MKAKKSHGLGKGISSLLGDYDINSSADEILNELEKRRLESMKEFAPTEAAPPVVEEVKVEEPVPVVEKPKVEAVKPEEEKKAISSSKPEASAADTVREVPIDDVIPNPDQPRKSFDELTLNELAGSVQKQGILQPLLVEEYAPGKYSIIAGERRYRAAKIAGLDKVPVLVRRMSEVQRIEVALIENIQREDLNPVDEAAAYQFLIQKSGLTQDEVAKRVGKSRSAITNSLRLLQLPDQVKDDLVSGVLTAGHARAILSLVNPSDRILLRNMIVEKDLSVRAAEAEAENLNQGRKLILRKKASRPVDPDVQAVEDKLLEAFKTRVEIKGSLRRGKLVIPYRTEAELERIYSLVGGSGLFDDEE